MHTGNPLEQLRQHLESYEKLTRRQKMIFNIAWGLFLAIGAVMGTYVIPYMIWPN